MSMLTMNFLAVFQLIPGLNNTIPGINKEYIPEKGAAAAAELFKTTYEDAFILLGLMIVISAIFTVVGLGENWTWPETLKRIGAVVILLVGFKFFFALPFIVGDAIGQEIFSDQDVQILNKKFEEIAQKTQEDKGVIGDPIGGKDNITKLMEFLSAFTSDIIFDVLAGVVSFVFFVSSVFMHIIWRIAVIILYVIGPILVVLSLIPGFGTKILANWFGAVLQVAFWQVWFAVCAFFVQTSDGLITFSSNSATSKPVAANHMESVTFALVFAVLYIATPFVVNLFLPISAFSGSLPRAFKQGLAPVVSTARTISNIASSVGSAVVGGVGFVTGGASLARETVGSAKTISTPMSEASKTLSRVIDPDLSKPANTFKID